MVIGDFMLDQQVHGAAERLSPDAPVPVLHATRFENTPGGTANVALCLRGLKGNVLCFGAVGADQEATLLRSALHDAGCDVNGIIEDRGRPTTIKRSLIGLAQHRHPQKMFRVDIESRDPLSDAMTSSLLKQIEGRLDEADVVLLEDYNKGVCSEAICRGVIDLCRRRKKPILVDPAAIEDYSKYKGATAVTPNRSEAELATGLDTPIDASPEHNAEMARTLLKDLDLEACIITLDKHGALLALKGPGAKKDPLHIPTVARNVYDVTGAGDMVLAALAGARANGFSWEDSVRFANAAAGLEVEVFGAQPIPFANVHRSLLAQCRNLEGKVRSLEDLLIELDVHRQSRGAGLGGEQIPPPSQVEESVAAATRRGGQGVGESGGAKIVLTNGCFDVIHAGHISYLREARKLGDVLVVAVNSDAQVRGLKGEGRPVFSQEERLEILSEFSCIDYLIVFEEPTAHEIIRAIQPNVYVKGGDYASVDDVAEADLLKPLIEKGVLEFRTVGLREGLSSSDVIERFARAYSRAPEARPPILIQHAAQYFDRAAWALQSATHADVKDMVRSHLLAVALHGCDSLRESLTHLAANDETLAASVRQLPHANLIENLRNADIHGPPLPVCNANWNVVYMQAKPNKPIELSTEKSGRAVMKLDGLKPKHWGAVSYGKTISIGCQGEMLIARDFSTGKSEPVVEVLKAFLRACHPLIKERMPEVESEPGSVTAPSPPSPAPDQ